MKFAILFVILISSSLVQASNFTCEGLINKTEKATIDIKFDSDRMVTVTDFEGTDVELDFDRSNNDFHYFADYDYDGYGGYIELRLPSNLNYAESKSFKVVYHLEVFSELGDVGNYNFTGLCSNL